MRWQKGIKLGSLHRKERKCKRKGVLPWQFSLPMSLSPPSWENAKKPSAVQQDILLLFSLSG